MKKQRLDLVIAWIMEMYAAGDGRNEAEKQLIENLACTVEHARKITPSA